MSKKEEIDKEDLEFLKELFGKPKREEELGQNTRKLEDLKKKIFFNQLFRIIQTNVKNLLQLK